jgi:outer membrane lipoprotein-sorting protein
VAVALCTNGNDAAPASLTSYYFRATIEVEGDDDDVLGAVLGWYEAPDRWRWDFGDGREEPDAGAVQVSDGETVVYYDRETNTYTRQPLAEYNEGRPAELTEGPPVIAGGFFIGWLPYGDRERFFKAWQDAVIEEDDGGKVAGRPADAVTVTRQGSSTTLWVDSKLPFVLKYESVSPGGPQGVLRVEVVEIELNGDVEDEVFDFEPAALALEVEAPEGNFGRSFSGNSGSGMVAAPEGFLTSAYVPEGYNVVGTGETYLGLGLLSRFSVRWESGDEYLTMVQQFRAGGLSETQKQGRHVSTEGLEGYDQSSGGVTKLVFARGDIVVTLEASALSLDELLRVAEGLR